MKRFLLAFFLVTTISVSTVFAHHDEDKFGVGIIGGWDFRWDGFTGSPSLALSLKVPNIPIFWGVNLRFNSNFYNLGISGDYYFIEKDLVSDIFLHWFVGLGGWANIGLSSGPLLFSFGARLPIGIHWHIIEFLEVFTNIAPSLGISINPFHFPEGGLPIEIGVRLWL
jgi:hypothetical protein